MPSVPSTTRPGTTTSVASPAPDTGDVAGFPTATITVGEAPWLVAVAETAELRARGLMGVADLGELDGMLFAFPAETSARFWMKNTLLPLDIAFFSADRTLVAVLTMEPCAAEPCPTYGPDTSYRWALEAPAGKLRGLAAGTKIRLDG